jgi:hypothetical protein
MDSEFYKALKDVVGMTDVQCALMESEGIYDVLDLINMSFTAILKGMDLHHHHKHLNVQQKSKLRAFKSWAVDQRYLNGRGNIEVEFFMADNCEEHMFKLLQKEERSEIPKETPSKDLSMPDPFSGHDKDWKLVKKNFLAYLGWKTNVHGVPLIYVIKDTMDVSDKDVDASIKKLIAQAPLSGLQYEKNKYELFQVLIAWTSAGSADTLVEEHKQDNNAHVVWFNLLRFYEGVDARLR